MHRFSTNGANGSEDRGGYTSAVLDKVVDMSVVVQRQVPMVQMVQKTVGHEEGQKCVYDCNRRNCGVSVDFDSLELKFRTFAIRMRINS